MSKLPKDLEHWLNWVEHENPEPRPNLAASKATQLLSDVSRKVLYLAADVIGQRNLNSRELDPEYAIQWALYHFPEALIALTRALYAPYAAMCEAVPECVETEQPQTFAGVDSGRYTSKLADAQPVPLMRQYMELDPAPVILPGSLLETVYDPSNCLVGVETSAGRWERSATGEWIKIG